MNPKLISLTNRAALARAWVAARMVSLVRVYLTLLFGWAVLHALFGDRWGWLFIISSFVEYLVWALPAVLLMALIARRRETWIGLGLALALGAYLYGELFLPQWPTQAQGKTLTVMSYNMLGTTKDSQRVIAAIRSAQADVVAIQELNPAAADAIRSELASDYPYQVLDPQAGVTGMGTISRYPLELSGEKLPGNWVGTPQVLTLEFGSSRVGLVHFHTVPTTIPNLDPRSSLAIIDWSVREREQEAQAIADYASAHTGPLVAVGDFNAGDQSTAYAIMTRHLTDAWREAGWGPGHTMTALFLHHQFKIGDVYLLPWLLRIDYVFHSRHWQAKSARVGLWDGQSDHRPVIVSLVLRGE